MMIIFYQFSLITVCLQIRIFILRAVDKEKLVTKADLIRLLLICTVVGCFIVYPLFKFLLENIGYAEVYHVVIFCFVLVVMFPYIAFFAVREIKKKDD